MMLDFILSLDKSLFILINSQWTAPWADQFFPAITDLHKHLYFKVLFVPALVLLFAWRKGIKKGLLIFLFCALGVAASDGIGNWAFKKVVQRPRPPETQGLSVNVRSPFGGYSFVSNHATNTFCMATYISAVFPGAALPLYASAALIAYSRVYNGVHFPSDVLAGALLGILVGFIFSLVCKRVLTAIDRRGKTA